ncbi:hypothetical protein Golob_013497 [Gossypium lobatum]|uniref:RNase H type-1 domain-containing protein n=1 Tax=Gossypium lobatum TaxID=34289 RepID=A0A7J8LPR8_9ROSI|nr:hypothetical protein [Gossypium lobatum]
MGACTIKNDFVPDSIAVKARAAIHSLRFARDMGFSCVELEGDARSIIRKLSGSDRVLGLNIADGKLYLDSFNGVSSLSSQEKEIKQEGLWSPTGGGLIYRTE